MREIYILLAGFGTKLLVITLIRTFLERKNKFLQLLIND